MKAKVASIDDYTADMKISLLKIIL
jgi:hypothetical protein